MAECASYLKWAPSINKGEGGAQIPYFPPYLSSIKAVGWVEKRLQVSEPGLGMD